MPLINVRLIEGVFTADQKRQMAERLTDTLVSIEGENLRAATTVIIDEVPSGCWAMGGRALTTQDVIDMAAGKRPGRAA
jgi:4-oxalocrotonate tautomerase